MPLFPIIILAIIQGITEFLPISSSGHLVLGHAILNDLLTLNDLDQKRLDIAVHIGTLLAVIIYFRSDFIKLVLGGFDLLLLRLKTQNAKLSLNVLISSIPVIFCGFALFIINMTIFDSLEIIGWTTLLFGIALYIADKKPETKNDIHDLTVKHAIIYGLFQCIALIPGVSRSGITMTAGRFMGYSRAQSARFSLFMGIVTITSAGALTSLSVFQDQTITNAFLTIIATGIIVSCIVAYITIFAMMKWFSGNGTMTPFVIYRILLGGALLALLYSGIISEKM
jgi:undecaprenyl-diphosphatase